MLFLLFPDAHDDAFGTEDQRNHFDAAVQGSSICPLLWWLNWVHMGNEYHSLHHINSRILGYKLEQCFKDGDSLFDSHLRAPFLQALYDESIQCFVRPQALGFTFSDVPCLLQAYAQLWVRSVKRGNERVAAK